MSDYTPSTGEVRRRYAYARSDKPGHKNQSAIAEFDRWLAAHDAEVLAAAGVTQPEPEYEYSWEGVDDEGDGWIMDEWFATVAGAERYADSRMGNWVRTDKGKLIRRVKAGAWEPAPNHPNV